MDGKLSVSIMLLTLAAMLMPVFAVASDCPDGTLNWKCSVVNPGERCVNGAPQITANPAPSPAGYGDKPYQFCPCSDIPEWTYNAAQDKCIKTSCTLGSVTKLNTQCFDANKPKYCDAGTVVDKASTCDCPTGKQASGETCIPITGWCNTDGDCRNPMKECKENSCANKVSCLFNNPPCLSSEQCREVSGQYQCVPKETSSQAQEPAEPETDYLNYAGSETPPAPSAQGNGLPTCCAPAAALLLVGAFAFSRKE